MLARRVVLALVLFPALALAQEASDAPNPTRVVLDVQTYLTTDLDRPVHPLVVRLGEESSLGSLDLSVTPDDVQELRAQFVFDGLAAYSAWRSSPETVALMDALRGTQGGLRASLSVRRSRYAHVLPE